MKSALNNIVKQLGETIIQPFPIHYDCHDYHVIAFIKDHPEYEAVEAMINEKGDGSAFIRAILTCHDKVQTDYINDSAVVERLKNKRRERKVVYTPILYQRSEKRGKSHVILKFTSLKNEEFVLDFYAVAKATGKHVQLIDPCGHSNTISLPVMYPERTTLASSRSSVKIDGQKYKLPVKIRIPLLFKGMQAYYSELFKIGVFRAGKEQLDIIKAPKSLNVGEKWVYQQGGEQTVYEIITVEGSRIVVSSTNTKIEAEIAEGRLNIKSISAISQPVNNPASVFAVTFTPSLPVFPERESSVFFSISIDEHKELISGTASAVQENGSLVYLLKPAAPDWAVSRPVFNVIEKREKGYSIKTEIVN